jgi:putative transcriptional regulator
MNPNHHPPEELLVAYAAGETPEAVSLVMACHATLCPTCRARLTELEALGGAMLEHVPSADLAQGALDRALAALEVETAPPTSLPELAAPPLPDGVKLPRPLLRYLGPAPQWQRMIPGVGAIKLGLGDAANVLRLVRLRPGITIPLHDHTGPELTLVFSGGLIEPERELHRGDFALRQPGERHVLKVAAEGPCVALTLNEGPLLPLTWLGRLFGLVARG